MNSDDSTDRKLTLMNGYAYANTFIFADIEEKQNIKIEFDYSTLYIYSADCLDIPLSSYGTKNIKTEAQSIASESNNICIEDPMIMDVTDVNIVDQDNGYVSVNIRLTNGIVGAIVLNKANMDNRFYTENKINTPHEIDSGYLYDNVFVPNTYFDNIGTKNINGIDYKRSGMPLTYQTSIHENKSVVYTSPFYTSFEDSDIEMKDFTIMIWMMLNTGETTINANFTKGNFIVTIPLDGSIEFSYLGHKITFLVQNDINYSNRWHHLALVYSVPLVMHCTNDGNFKWTCGKTLSLNTSFVIVVKFFLPLNETTSTITKHGNSKNTSYILYIEKSRYIRFVFMLDKTLETVCFDAGKQLEYGEHKLILRLQNEKARAASTEYTKTSKKITSDYGFPDTKTLQEKPCGQSEFTGAPPPQNNSDTSNESGSSENYSIIISIDGGLEKTFQIEHKSDNTFCSFDGCDVQLGGSTMIYYPHLKSKMKKGKHEEVYKLLALKYGNTTNKLTYNDEKERITNVLSTHSNEHNEISIIAAGISTHNGDPNDMFDATNNAEYKNWDVVWTCKNGKVINLVDENNILIADIPSSGDIAEIVPDTVLPLRDTVVFFDTHPFFPNIVIQTTSKSDIITPRNFSVNLADRHRFTDLLIWKEARTANQIKINLYGSIIPELEPTLLVMIGGPPKIGKLTKPYGLLDVEIETCLIPLPVTQISGPLVSQSLFTPVGTQPTFLDKCPKSGTMVIDNGTLRQALVEVYAITSGSGLRTLLGRKVGDITLTWVKQEQGSVQLIGYIEGAPPCPAANLPKSGIFESATYCQMTRSNSFTVETQSSIEKKYKFNVDYEGIIGSVAKADFAIEPMGFGTSFKGFDIRALIRFGVNHEVEKIGEKENVEHIKQESTTSYRLNSVEMLPAISNDDYNIALRKMSDLSFPTEVKLEERFGKRVSLVQPYGTAYVKSNTIDVFEQKLEQTGTIFGYTSAMNTKIPSDFNMIRFKLNPRYVQPGVLDGILGYGYMKDKPGTMELHMGYKIGLNGEILPNDDYNLKDIGWDASYMKITETYDLKKEIDKEQLVYVEMCKRDETEEVSSVKSGNIRNLGMSRTFPNNYIEHVWSATGGHMHIAPYGNMEVGMDEMYTYSCEETTGGHAGGIFKIDLGPFALNNDLKIGYATSNRETFITRYSSTETNNLEVNFDGVNTSTQMMAESINDLAFAKKNNLRVGSDCLIYDVDGTPYDRPGQVKQFRSYTFHLQPKSDNMDVFFNKVVDPIWLQSKDPNAIALNTVDRKQSAPWRIFHRVTYVDRVLAPIDLNAIESQTYTLKMKCAYPCVFSQTTEAINNSSVYECYDSKGIKMNGKIIQDISNGRAYYVKSYDLHYPKDTSKWKGSKLDIAMYKKYGIAEKYPIGGFDVLKERIKTDYPNAMFTHDEPIRVFMTYLYSWYAHNQIK